MKQRKTALIRTAMWAGTPIPEPTTKRPRDTSRNTSLPTESDTSSDTDEWPSPQCKRTRTGYGQDGHNAKDSDCTSEDEHQNTNTEASNTQTPITNITPKRKRQTTITVRKTPRPLKQARPTVTNPTTESTMNSDTLTTHKRRRATPITVRKPHRPHKQRNTTVTNDTDTPHSNRTPTPKRKRQTEITIRKAPRPCKHRNTGKSSDTAIDTPLQEVTPPPQPEKPPQQSYKRRTRDQLETYIHRASGTRPHTHTIKSRTRRLGLGGELGKGRGRSGGAREANRTDEDRGGDPRLPDRPTTHTTATQHDVIHTQCTLHRNNNPPPSHISAEVRGRLPAAPEPEDPTHTTTPNHNTPAQHSLTHNTIHTNPRPADSGNLSSNEDNHTTPHPDNVL